MSLPVLPEGTLYASAEDAIGGLKAGLVMSRGHLGVANRELAAVFLVAAWRRSSKSIETSLPFAAIATSLESGEIARRWHPQPDELGIYPGRILPGPLDDFVKRASVEQVHQARDVVRERSARVWELFRDKHEPLTDADREMIHAFRAARETGLHVRDLVYQEALHPDYAKWLKAA